MTSLRVIAVVGALGVLGCTGGGGPQRIDSYPADAGVVREREVAEEKFWLRLESANASGWQPVSSYVYDRCQVGDIWIEDRSGGCT